MERSLPPDVQGPVYGELRICVDLISWSIARPPPVCQVRAKFWGEKSYGCVFRPDDSSSFVAEEDRQMEAASSNTVFYCVRVKSLLFSRYLRDMSSMALEVLDGKSYALLGKSKINVAETADEPVIADGFFTIFAADGAAVGKVRAFIAVDYFQSPRQAEHSFEALEDMIEMETPLSLHHSKSAPLHPRGGVAPLPNLLRSSVASVGGYEGSSDGGYIDVDASMSEDAHSHRPIIVQRSAVHKPRQTAHDYGRSVVHRSDSSGNCSRDDDSTAESDIYSSDAPLSPGSSNRLSSSRPSMVAAESHVSTGISHEDSLHRNPVSRTFDSSSPSQKDALMIQSALLRRAALQQPLRATSPPLTQGVNSPSSSFDHQSSLAAVRHDARHEAAVQTSFAHRNVTVAEVSVDAHFPEQLPSSQSHSSRIGLEQTVDRSIMTEPNVRIASSGPHPAWNSILDSLSARLGAMRSRVVSAEQMLVSASSSAPYVPRPAVHETLRNTPSAEYERTKAISFADESPLRASVRVAPYSPVRVSGAVADADGAVVSRVQSDKLDNVSLSELADVFNSQDEAALLSSLFFAKSQQPPAPKHSNHNSPHHPTRSPSAHKTTSSISATGRNTSTGRSAEPARRTPSTPVKAAIDSPSPQATASDNSTPHSWFVSVDSVSFSDSSQKVSVKCLRAVIKVPRSVTARDFITPSTIRVRWLGSRLPRHSLAVVFVDASQAAQRATVPSAPAIIIELWDKDMKTLEPRIVGVIRCPVRAGVSSSPAGSRIPKLTSTGVWAAVLDSGNFIYDGTSSIRNPLSGIDVGHACISILQQSSDTVDAVVRAADAVVAISGAVRCHFSRKIFKALQMRRQKTAIRKELRLSRPLSRRAVVEVACDSSSEMFSHTFKVELQGLFGIGDWSGASSICLRARFPGQKEWIESGRTAIVKGSAAALAASSYSWVLPANQNLSSVLTDADGGADPGLCIHVHDGSDARRQHPPMRQYCVSTSELLALSGAAIESRLASSAPDVLNGSVKKIFRIPAREFGQGCVLKVVVQCRVVPSTVSTVTLTSLSHSSRPKLFLSNNSFILGVICASGLQTAADIALASLPSNSSLSVASIDGINAFATVSFTPPASHLLPGLNGSHVYVTTVAPMTFAPKWDWKVQFPIQLSREVCAALAVSSLTVSVYHRPISRVVGQRENDVLIGHAAAPLAHLFTKHSGLATWVPLVCGSSGLPAASILLFSNIEATVGEAKHTVPSTLLCDAFDVDDADGLTGVFEASLEELILLDGCVASLLGGCSFTSAQITWHIPGIETIEVKVNLGNKSSGAGPSTSRVVALQCTVSRAFDLSVDAAHCLTEKALEIDIALCSQDADGTDQVALGTCYVDASSLLDRPSQFDLPTQARWLSGAFAVIHPSGSRCGAAVRVRLQLRFKKTAKAQVAQPRSNVVACVQAPAPRAVEADPATNASSTQSTPTPPLASMTLTLESVRHVFLPPKFDESESVYLSLTTTLDGDIVHNTAPMLLSGKIDCEDVVSLPSRTIGFSNITVILSAQNESNTKAAVLGSSEVDLSMLSLMKCISGWYGILDSSGNCVAYVKLRIDSKTTSAAAAFSRQETAVPSDDSLIERSSSIAPSTHNQTMTTGAPVSEFSHFFVQDSAPSTQPIDVEVDEYSAPSLEELRSKMKELDSVSLRLKKMLHDDDWQGLDPGNDCRALAENCDASNDISSTCVADNTAPQALIAYADSLVARDFEIGRPQHRQHAVDCGLQSRESGSHGEFAQSSIERLQRVHLHLQQNQQDDLLTQPMQHIQLLPNSDLSISLQSDSKKNHHQQPLHQYSPSTSAERVGNREAAHSFHSSQSPHTGTSARHQDSSSDSDLNDSVSSFLRGDVLTTSRSDKQHSRSSLMHTASESSVTSSVASSQEFPGLLSASEAQFPAHSLSLESGYNLRQKYDAKHQRLASILFPPH